MALSQYWVSQNRKDMAERAIVAKRQAELHSAQRRESAARFHRELNLMSAQYKNIEDTISGRTQRVNQESFIEEEVRARRKEKLQLRQKKLMLLLAEENEKYLRELKAISEEQSPNDSWSVATLKEQIEELKKRRKQHEEALAKKSMAHQYHINDTMFIDKKQTDALEKQVKASWEQKKQDVEKKAAEKTKEDTRRQEALYVQLEEAKKQAEQAHFQKEEAVERWNTKMKELTDTMNENLTQCERLQVEIEILKSHQKAVENVVKKRSDVKEIQNQRKQRIEMFRKSKEKVRKIASEVKHLLEVDLATLNFLIQLGNKDKEESSSRLDLQVVADALESVKKSLAKEDKRDTELQILFEEEAVKMMSKWRQAWDEDMEVHERNMNNVFESLDSQIKNKIEEYKRMRQNYMNSIENFSSDMEIGKSKSEMEIHDLEAKQEYYVNKIRQLEEEMNRFNSVSAKWPPPKLRK